MDGLIYLLNQAGIALAQANQRIEQLEAELSKLSKEQKSKPNTKTS